MSLGKHPLEDGEDGESRKARRLDSEGSKETLAQANHESGAREAIHLPAELMEHILEDLSMKDLLLSQRVSKWWQAVIIGSPKLQRILFFAPERPTCRWFHQHYPDGDHFRVSKAHAEAPLGSVDDNASRIQFGTVNPFFLSPSYEDPYCNQRIFCESPGLYRYVDLNFRPPPQEGNATWSPTASWRKMLLTQPPAHKFSFFGRDVSEKLLVLMPLSRLSTIGDVVQSMEDHEAKTSASIVSDTRINVYDMLFLSKEERYETELHSGKLRYRKLQGGTYQYFVVDESD